MSVLLLRTCPDISEKEVNMWYTVQCFHKVFRRLHFSHILLCCSLLLKSFKYMFSLINLYSIPHNDKAKTCVNWLDMIWKLTMLTMHIIADNAYQNKNQAMRSKELPAELRDRIVSRHRSGEGYKYNSAALKVPIVPYILNRRGLEQPGLFLELATQPNWEIGGEGPW